MPDQDHKPKRLYRCSGPRCRRASTAPNYRCTDHPRPDYRALVAQDIGRRTQVHHEPSFDRKPW